jgi:hypothetical protein
MVIKMTWHKESERHSLAKRKILTKNKQPNNLIIKTPNVNFKVIIKSKKEMKDYIALHGLVPDYELPNSMDSHIPINEVWIREDIYRNKDRFKRVLWHETEELKLMTTQGLHYKKAHNITTEKEIKTFGCSGISKPYKTRSQVELERLERWERAVEVENNRYPEVKEKSIRPNYKQEREIQQEKEDRIKDKKLKERNFWLKEGKKIEIKKTDKKLELEDFY